MKRNQELALDDDFKRLNRRRLLLVAAGIALAVVAGLVTLTAFQQAEHIAGATTTTRSVLVAARDIPARTVIASSDLTLRSVPVDPSLASAMTDPGLVIGRISGIEIAFEEPITPNLLGSASAGGQFSILGPSETISPNSPAWRAVSISVPDDRAVAGQVVVGAHVDVFVTVQVNVTGAAASLAPSASASPSASGSPLGAYYTDKSTKLVYQDVLVLAKSGSLYVLRVDEQTAEEISQLQAAGNASFSLALRPDQDTRQLNTTTYGETTNKIVQRYGFPIPQVYPTP
jgi:Flp pilus assembly protein CpaB